MLNVFLFGDRIKILLTFLSNSSSTTDGLLIFLYKLTTINEIEKKELRICIAMMLEEEEGRGRKGVTFWIGLDLSYSFHPTTWYSLL